MVNGKVTLFVRNGRRYLSTRGPVSPYARGPLAGKPRGHQ